MPINHRHIEVFRAVMTSGSVTKAADLLHTSQPTVSRELARLETLLGICLFDRLRGRLQATTPALALFEEVQRSYVGIERIVSTAASLRQFSSGQLALVCLPALSHALLPAVCARFLAAHPGVSVAITPQESPFLEDALSAQRYDLGLTERNATPPGTKGQTLFSADEVCVLPDGHPLLAKTELTPADFAGQPFVSLSPSDPYRQLLDETFASHQVERRLVAETHSAVAVCAMVREGVGLAIVNPLTALDYAGRGLAIRRFSVPIAFCISIVQPLHRPGNPLVERFVAALEAEAKNLSEKLLSWR